MFVTFREVDPNSDTQFLWDLFQQKPTHKKISSVQELSFDAHTAFVKNHPYEAWMIIELQSQDLGSVFLTKFNEVGISLLPAENHRFLEVLKAIVEEFRPLPQIPSFRNGSFVINSSVNDVKQITAVEQIGAKPIQVTHSLADIGHKHV